MAKLPTFDSRDFNWLSGRGESTIGKLRIGQFPASGFYIRSHKTGAMKLFLPDSETMTENEFFDGEAYAYFVPGGDVTIRIWN